MAKNLKREDESFLKNTDKNSSDPNVGIFRKLKIFKKHPLCPHPHSCLHYAGISSLKIFAYSCAAQLTLNTVLKWKEILHSPQFLLDVIYKKEIYDLPIFLFRFSGLFKIVSCTLRRTWNKDSPYFSIPAALLASVAFRKYRSTAIALSVTWKALHILWNEGIKEQILPNVEWFPVFLFGLSAGVLCQAVALQPHHVRGSFWKLIEKASNGRLNDTPRVHLDAFGYNSSESLEKLLYRLKKAK